jgi:hypothetical protein
MEGMMTKINSHYKIKYIKNGKDIYISKSDIIPVVNEGINDIQDLKPSGTVVWPKVLPESKAKEDTSN